MNVDFYSNYNCGICLDAMNTGNSIAPHSGEGEKHRLHKSCLLTWLAKQNTCPVCRTPIDEFFLWQERGAFYELKLMKMQLIGSTILAVIPLVVSVLAGAPLGIIGGAGATVGAGTGIAVTAMGLDLIGKYILIASAGYAVGQVVEKIVVATGRTPATGAWAKEIAIPALVGGGMTAGVFAMLAQGTTKRPIDLEEIIGAVTELAKGIIAKNITATPADLITDILGAAFKTGIIATIIFAFGRRGLYKI